MIRVRCEVPVLVLGLGVAIASTMLNGPLDAQASTVSVLEGRVMREDSVPVSGATIRVIQGASSQVVRSDDLGRYRVARMVDGTAAISVQAVGHVSFFERLTFAGPLMRRDFTLKRVQTELAPVYVEGNWSGVRGFVVDERGFVPLDSARIRVLSQGGELLTTDTSGRFSLEKPDGYDVRLLVEREGYARRVVMAKATRLAAERLVIRLDTLWDPVKNWIEWQDLSFRVRFMSPMAAVVSGDEIREAGSIAAAPTLTRKGIRFTEGVCLLVNGIPRPGGMLFDLKEIDFIEAYPAGSEHSGSLASRWGSKGACGVDFTSTVVRPSRQDYLVVWLKTPPPPPRAAKPE